MLGTERLMPSIRAPNSAGVAYPTVSGMLMVLAPAAIAASIT